MNTVLKLFDIVLKTAFAVCRVVCRLDVRIVDKTGSGLSESPLSGEANIQNRYPRCQEVAVEIGKMYKRFFASTACFAPLAEVALGC